MRKDRERERERETDRQRETERESVCVCVCVCVCMGVWVCVSKACTIAWFDYIYIYIYIYIYEVHTISFQTFFVWTLLWIVYTWKSCTLQSNHLGLQYTCCTIPNTSGKPHGSPLVWACQWPSSQPLSAPQLSHNDSLWTEGITKITGSNVWTIGRVTNCLNAHLGQIVCDNDWVVDWCIVLVEMLLTWFEECWPLSTESLPELP